MDLSLNQRFSVMGRVWKALMRSSNNLIISWLLSYIYTFQKRLLHASESVPC